MLSFRFNLQLKLKNTIDVGGITDQASAKVQPEVINKEGRLDDREENIEEGVGAEGGDDKVDLTSADSQDAQGKNGYKPKQRNREGLNDKGTITSPNGSPFFDVEPRCAIMEDEEPSVHGHHGHSSGLGESGKNTEVSIIIRSDLKDSDENRKQGEDLQMLTVDKLSEQTKTNINDSFDVRIKSPPILSQPSPTSFKQEKEEKKQPVMSTLAVPSIHFGPVPKRKELPAEPECKKTREKETLITAKKESTEEFKIIIQPKDEHPGDAAADDDDDEVISAEDLLCFSWQIAQGMVSRQPRSESHRL